jgi:DNA-binding XRE family transcriptional regulator
VLLWLRQPADAAHLLRIESPTVWNWWLEGIYMENLKNLRVEVGLSQTELAMRAGVARWKLGMTETGQVLENAQCPLRPSEQAPKLT